MPRPRPPRRTPRPSPPLLPTGPDDLLLYAVAAFAALVTATALGVWAAGQLAGLLTTGHWPPVAPGQAVGILLALPGHLADPRAAWPTAAQHELPGPFAFYGVACVLLLAARRAGRHRRPRHRPAPAGPAHRRPGPLARLGPAAPGPAPARPERGPTTGSCSAGSAAAAPWSPSRPAGR